MKKLLLALSLIFLITSVSVVAQDSGKLLVQIRHEIVNSETERGQSLFGSFFYCLVSFPSFTYEMHFEGNPDAVIEIIEQNMENYNRGKNNFTLNNVSYNESQDQIFFSVTDNSCLEYHDNAAAGFCDYGVTVKRFR